MELSLADGSRPMTRRRSHWTMRALLVLQEILASPDQSERLRRLYVSTLIFLFACVVVAAIVIIWRAPDIRQIIEDLLASARVRTR
jgi:hypothetical protein